MTDIEFVQRCVKGDKRAWDEFIDKYSRLIYNYIHSALKIKGYAFAEGNLNDIFQDIVLFLAKDNFKKLSTFKAKNGCSLASWLRQVTVNYTIDYIRKLKPVVSIDADNDSGLSLAEMLASDCVSVKDTLTQEERLVHLKDCIDKLDTEDKYFLELYIQRNFSPLELKAHLRISRPAVDMRKSRIIERLKECFQEKGMLDF